MANYIHELGHVLNLAHPFHPYNKKEIWKGERLVVTLDNYLNDPDNPDEYKEEAWAKNKKAYKIANRNSYIYYRNKYTILGEGTTKCLIMDYLDKGNPNPQKVFTQWQWRVLQESVSTVNFGELFKNTS